MHMCFVINHQNPLRGLDHFHRLYADIFGDGGGCHLHVVGQLLEGPPVLAPQWMVDRFDLQKIVAGMELGCGEGHSGASADPVPGNLPDAVGDILQEGGDGVATSVHRSGSGGCCGVEGLDLRLQD